MDETHVRAPALIAGDPMRFRLSGGGFPEHFEVHSNFSQIADRLAQFARPDPPVKIDHRGRFAGGARHRPRLRPIHIGKLCAVMEG